MTRGLTDRQQDIYDFVVRFMEENYRPPSLREICREFKMASTRAASDHINALVRKGFLIKDEDVARGLRLSRRPREGHLAGDRGRYLPVLGRVAAGSPMLAEENVLEKLLVDEQLCAGRGGSGSESFLLQVQGDSMIEAGILPGDLIIVRATETAEDGDIVVALFEDEGEATVKRLERRGARIRLVPANSSLKPIPVPDPSALRIRGVVTGLIRRFK